MKPPVEGRDRGLIYEPRAFWEVFRIDTSVDTVYEIAPRRRFHNGSRHPITLRRVALSAVNYALRENVGNNNPPLNLADFHNCSAIIDLVQVIVSAPQRQHYSRRLLYTPAWGQLPTQEPGMRYHTDGANLIAASGLLGLSYLEFDKPMLLPKQGSALFELSGWTIPAIVATENVDPVRHSILWHEKGGLNEGQGRLRGSETLTPMNTPPVNIAGGQNVPLQPDGWGANFIPGFNNQWPPNNKMTPHDFNEENPTRRGSSEITGLGVHIEQIVYDNAIVAAALMPAGSPITPISQRICCRARTTNGGTGEWWWRPGAPMALVLDTITPAKVYPLDPEITLGPGDTLDVEVRVPGPQAFPNSSPPITLSPAYQFGISFNGYAAIEG